MTACGIAKPEPIKDSGWVCLVKTIASKAESENRPTEKRLLVNRFAMTMAVIMILLSSHSFFMQWGQRGEILGGVSIMTENNVNIDFIGIMNLLRYLLAEGHITEEERPCISARIANNTGANIIVLNR